MKFRIIGIPVALLILGAVLWYRAETVFEDAQLTPAQLAPAPPVDAESAARRLAGALRYPTISWDDRTRFDADAFDALHGYLERTFPHVHRRLQRTVVNSHSLVYHLPGADPGLEPVLFMGHLDVVPVDPHTREQWRHDPFGGVIADGAVWGRGAVDDKLGVMAMLEAVELLARERWQPRRSLYLAFGHDEEVGGNDGAARIAAYFAERGTRFQFVLDEGGAVTQGVMEGVQAPVAVIGVAEKGWLNLELEVRAPGGHSSQPPPHTAVGILSRAIVRLENAPLPATLDFLHMTVDAIAQEMPFGLRLLFANQWLFEPLITHSLLRNPDDAAGLRTTTAATMITGSPKSNILPTVARAVVNFRVMPGETADSVRAAAARIIDDERVRLSPASHWDPSPASSTSSEGYRMIAQTIRGMDPGILVAPYLVRGGTDGRHFTGLSDHVYRFLMVPVDPQAVRRIHGIDEHVRISDYATAIRFYYHLFMQAMDPFARADDAARSGNEGFQGGPVADVEGGAVAVPGRGENPDRD